MINNRIQIVVELENGTICSEYNRNSNTYIEGRKGSVYNIRITNNNYFRVGVVVSVDGLNVIDGKLASDNGEQYLINGYANILIKGFRTTSIEVRKFQFSFKESSYSNKTGNGIDNTGVIGIIVFREKIPVTYDILDSARDWINIASRKVQVGSPYQPQSLRSLDTLSYSVAPLCLTNYTKVNASHVPTQLGTAMGDKAQSEVTYVEFIHEDKSLTRMVIFYNTRKELEKMGLIVKKISNPTKIPNPFPGNYCKEV